MKKIGTGLLAALFLASCSSYQKDFRASTKEFQKITKPISTPAGPWKGTWQSEVNGHHGPLWCLISRDRENLTLWNFRYRAGWGVLQFGDYTHQLHAKLSPASVLPLKGQMTLPNNFGTYGIEGTADPLSFKVRYQGNGDKGTMTLTRP